MSRWEQQPSTLEEIEALPGEVLSCENVAKVLGTCPNTLHDQAMDAPWRLGFPVICAGRRVKIPKRAFVRFMKEGKCDVNS